MASEPIPKNYGTNLPNLVRLGVGSFSLQIDELLNARLYKHVMATSDTLLKSQISEELTKIIEADIGV